MEDHTFDRLIVKIMAISKPDAITPGEVYGLVSQLSAAVQHERASRYARVAELEAEKQTLLSAKASLKGQVAALRMSPAAKEIQKLRSMNGTLKRDLALLGQEALKLETEVANYRTMSAPREPSPNGETGLLMPGSADEEWSGRPVVNLGARLVKPAPAFSRGPKQAPATSNVKPGDRLRDRSVLASSRHVSSSTLSAVDTTRDPRLPLKVYVKVEHTLKPAGSKRSFSEHTKDSPAKKIKIEPSIDTQSPRSPTSFESRLTAIADLDA